MRVFQLIREPAKPYKAGSSREAAWKVAKAMNGKSVEEVIAAWGEMERWRGSDTEPSRWLEFFCGPHRKRDGRMREVVAKVIDPTATGDDPGDATTERFVRAAREESMDLWELAREVFGEEDVTQKLVGHLLHLRSIQRERG